ncbi:MAG: SMI1/KNR4 family protein [Rubripirellula sp.]
MATFSLPIPETRIETTFPPLTARVVDRFASESGWSLPDDYLSFLAWKNGFQCDPNSGLVLHYAFEWDTDGVLRKGEAGQYVQEFFGIAESTDDIRGQQASYNFNRFAPHGVYCIGWTPGLTQIAISTRDDDFGYVYHWPSTRAFADEKPESEWQRIHEPIASSFSSFWSKLEPYDRG